MATKIKFEGHNPYQRYFSYLASLVGRHCDAGQPDGNMNTFTSTLRWLHTKEFRWFVMNDDNRNADGLALRRRYEELTGEAVGPENLCGLINASLFEVIIGCASRLSFFLGGNLDGDDRAGAFWMIMGNLKLDKRPDKIWNNYDGDFGQGPDYETIVSNLILRRFDVRGNGSMFPLRYPPGDPCTAEIWMQMNWYAHEILDPDEAFRSQ